MYRKKKKIANHKRCLRAQGTLEYVILVVVIITALLTMQVYIKRSIQGRLRSSADDIGDQFSTWANGEVVFNSYSRTNQYTASGLTYSNLVADMTQNRTESFNFDQGANGEYWGVRE